MNSTSTYDIKALAGVTDPDGDPVRLFQFRATHDSNQPILEVPADGSVLAGAFVGAPEVTFTVDKDGVLTVDDGGLKAATPQGTTHKVYFMAWFTDDVPESDDFITYGSITLVGTKEPNKAPEGVTNIDLTF